ncbi:unnamed protein product, partial [Mesorhabditis belari]|uniref:Structural maintenance of chromosomes protein 5 n=3 Tax=Mesorhabditis belari TaxID=2138241 RepID=A0AAF3FFU2_9BILA
MRRGRKVDDDPFPEAREMNINRTAFDSLPYPDGSLKTIEFTQFLTFNHVFMEAGPNLNVLIGPNGSGKSSIICGICLAMGGRPELLGRSERFADYIKHNASRGFVEVTVSDKSRPSGVTRFRIVIDRSTEKGKVEYFIDGKQATRTAVAQAAHDYNIQIENPCTFLAQDKVKSFAAQDPKELLINTQKAGDLTLLRMHDGLREEKAREKDLKLGVQEYQSALEKIQNEIVALEPKVESYKKQESMVGRIQVLRRKAAILAFTKAEEKYGKATQGINELKKKVVKINEELETHKKEEKRLEKSYGEYKERRRENEQQIRESAQKMEENEDPRWYNIQMRDITDKLNQEKGRLRSWEQNLNQMQAAVTNAKEALESAQSERDALKPREAEARQKQQDLQRRFADIGSREQQLENAIFESNAQRRKAGEVQERNENLLRERLNQLPNHGQARDAYMYYKQHRNEFRRPIYVPMIDIKIRGGDNELTLLSNVLQARDGTTFIFGCKDDELKLTERFSKINTTVVDNAMLDRVLSKLTEFEIPEEARQIGILGTMLDVIECNEVIRVFLAQGCSWTKLLRGERTIDKNYAEVADRLKQWKSQGSIFTSHNQITWSVSQYSREVLVEQRPLSCERKRFYVANLKDYEKIDPDLAKKYETQRHNFEQRRQELQREKSEITAERAKIHSDLQDFYKKTEVCRHGERIYRDKQAEFAAHQADKPNVERVERDFQDRKKRTLNESLHRADRVFEAKHLHFHASLCYETLCQAVNGARDKRFELDGLTRIAQQKFNEAKNELKDKEQQIKQETAEYEEAKVLLKRLVKLETLTKNKLSKAELLHLKEIEQDFEEYKIPKDADEVERLIVDEETRVQLVQGGGVGTTHDLTRLEQLKRQMAQNELRKATATETFKEYEAKLGEAIDKWCEPLEELVKKISKNFTEFFALMDWRGEVLLEKPENKLDIDKYGIAIHVAFRETERLRRLDDKTQSGGERSVATMLYLLSLQELCPVPFRCVDEINQGMDPRNERKVFSLIVDTLASESRNLAKTQYFLLTPKLLRGLKYGEKVAVHLVHNSPTLPPDIMEWEHSAFIPIMPLLQ